MQFDDDEQVEKKEEIEEGEDERARKIKMRREKE